MKHSVRVALIPIEESAHAEILFQWRRSPEIARFMYTRDDLVWESHLGWIRSLPQNPSREDFVITLDGDPVGSVNLTDINTVHRRCEFGMYIADPRARVQGAGAAAEVLILDHAFRRRKLHKVSCEVFGNNPAPMTLHKRMGFEIEGTFRDHVLEDDQWIDVIRMSLLEEPWQSQREKMRRMLARLIG